MSRSRWLYVSLLVVFAGASFAMADAGDNILRFGIESINPTGDLSFDDSLNSEFVSTEEFPGLTEDGFIDVPELLGKAEVDSATGIVISFEHMVTDLLGIEFGLGYAKHDVEVKQTGEGTFFPLLTDQPGPIDFSRKQPGEVLLAPITIGLNYHPLEDAPVDFYFGPFIAYVLYGDVELDALQVSFSGVQTASASFSSEADELGVDPDFGYGLVVGADIPFGGGDVWAFSIAARYLATTAEIEDGEDSTIDLDVDPWTIRAGLAVRF